MRIEQGRYRKEEIEERVCEFCDSKEVEDEQHFMLRCKTFTDLRTKMWRTFQELTGRDRNSFESDDERLNALIGDRFQPSENTNSNRAKSIAYSKIARAVMTYITTAMNRRRGLQG